MTVQANGYVPEGDLMLYQYHPPFAPGFLRLNEVMYNVANSTKVE